MAILTPDEYIMELQKRDGIAHKDYTIERTLYREQYDAMLIQEAARRRLDREEIRMELYREFCECCSGRNNG